MHWLRRPAVRWLLTILLLGLLAFQLWSRSNHFTSLSLISIQKSFWWFLPAVLMMPFNWLLESVKWRSLLCIHFRCSFVQVLKAVMGGVALSIFTPNRIGEYGGRLMFMPVEAKWPVVISTLAGSFSQNLIAFTAGVLSCIVLFEGFILLKIMGLIFIGMAFYFFFNMSKVILRISTWRTHSIFTKIVLNLRYVEAYTPNVLIKVLCIALLRYLIYTIQYVLILHAFEPDIQPVHLLLGISAIYLFQTLIPLPPGADVMARANLGLILWSGTGMSELSISLASLMIWVINLLIPALIGSFIIGTTASLISLDKNESNIPPALMPVASESTE
ncbi:MAG: lysylphosphatidylglycerol synthase domain-containing protein [Saprospiraceae bacterium]